MKTRWQYTILGIFLLASVGGFAIEGKPSQAQALSAGWSQYTVGNAVAFAYPANFVTANDGFPYVRIAGGALLNPKKTAYELLLGVEVNNTPDVTVQQEATRLISAYGRPLLKQDRASAWGRKLVFQFPDHSTYTVILSPLHNGLREILINNERSDPTYNEMIQTFLGSIHNLPNV